MFFHISSKDIASIIVNVAFVATFLSIFFFTYTKTVEKQIIMNNMSYITNELVGELSIFIPKFKKTTVASAINAMPLPNMQKEDANIIANNKKILITTIKYVLPFLLISLGGTYYMSKKYDFSYGEVLKQSFMTIAVIALVEFIFLNVYASKYIAADTNYVKYIVLDILEKNSN